MADIRVRFVGGPGKCSEKHSLAIRDLQTRIFGYVQEPVENNYWWLAFDGAVPVGFASLYHYRTNRESAFLSLCGVLNTHRGHRLQRRFVRARVAKARQLGIKRVISYTSSDNAPSANNLIECGFRVYVPRWEWGVKNAIYFRKHLE